MTSSQASWSDLPSDFLWKIIKLLPLADFIRFGGVCISWHNALAEKRCPPRLQAPWLVLPCTAPNIDSRVRFLSLSEKRDYCVHLPEKFSRLACIGYTAGWLVLSSESELYLFDPLSRDQKSFPSPPLRVHNPTVTKVCVSQPQASGRRSLIVGVLCLVSNKMAFLKDGDESWTTLKTPENRTMVNITFYKDLLVGFCQLAGVVAYDVSGDPTVVFDVMPSSNMEDSHHVNFYNQKDIVESSGHLLQVWKKMESSFHSTTDVRVFKLDLDLEVAGEARWIELSNLEDQALYLGPGQSHSVSANDSRGLKKNNVYFLDFLKYENIGYLKEYDMRDRTSKFLPYQFDMNPSYYCSRFWFIPNYQ